MGQVVAIAVPIILAIWSGAAFLAIKHPETYLAFGMPLFAASAALSLIFIGYAVGAVWGMEAVAPYLRGNEISQAYEANRAAATAPFSWGLIFGAFAIGLMVIGSVGGHIERQRKTEDGEDSQDGEGK